MGEPAHGRLELEKGQFDQIVIEALWPREQGFSPSGGGRVMGPGSLVAGEVVENGAVA